MTALLDQMARTSRDRARATYERGTLADWRQLALARPAAPKLKLSGFDLIAECKLRAPSAGRLAGADIGPEDLVRRAAAYAQAGACAISVLTEPHRFDGDLSHLEAVAATSPVPAMRKDFLVDPVQVYEGRSVGAGGVLLITRMLDDATLSAMLDAALECGMFVLIECFDAQDAQRTGAALQGREGDLLVGVNTRDLQSLEVRSERLEALVGHLPVGFPWVAESGMATAEDVRMASLLGYKVALVGSALMQAPDPAALAQAMLEAGQ